MNLKILQSFLPNLEHATLLDTFSNYEAGGEFFVYEVSSQEYSDLSFVCLFEDAMRLANPFNPITIAEIELGHTWRVSGCIIPGSGEIVQEKAAIPLALADSDKEYFLYLVEKLR